MKKLIKLLAAALMVLAFIAVFASCGARGGTIDVTNGDTKPALVLLFAGAGLKTNKNVDAGKKVSFSVDEDGLYTVLAVFESDGLSISRTYTKTVALSGGDTVSVEAKP